MRWRLVLIVAVPVALLTVTGMWWWNARGAPQLGQAALDQTLAILAHGPRPPGSDALDSVRNHLRAELERAGWVTAGQAFQQDTPEGVIDFENLRARFPAGTGDPWTQSVAGVLGAHVDSKLFKDQHFLGADDAASACAAIVEIAKFLAKERPAQAKAMELVFFDGEESFGPDITPRDGLYGSRHYANHWRKRPDKPRFGVVLDMIGHERLSIRLPSDTPADLRDRVMAAAKAEGAERHFGMAAGPITDDHVPLNFAGIPTVDIIGDFGRADWWHTPSDNAKILSAKSLDISIRVTLRLLNGLLSPGAAEPAP